MARSDVHAAADGYTRAADVYARARPSYPDGAVDWLLAALGGPARVVEVGAGTGKLTAQLVARSVEILAVEPVAAMRARLDALGRLVRPLDATAEALPLDAATVDAIVASQSLHWTDVPRALTEFDRVLRDGGAVGLLWNFRDVSVPWQRDLDELLAELRGSAPHSRDGRWERAVPSSAFELAGSAAWRWSLPTDEAGVVDRVRSASYVAALGGEEQQAVADRVRAILARHALAGRAIEFPYVTEAYVLRRRER
jgi:SAM-dependent methyltransferase